MIDKGIRTSEPNWEKILNAIFKDTKNSSRMCFYKQFQRLLNAEKFKRENKEYLYFVKYKIWTWEYAMYLLHLEVRILRKICIGRQI